MPIWRPAALADHEKIVEYIALDNINAAIDLGDLLFEKAQVLDKHPLMGRTGIVEGTRELVVHSNYILIYRVVDGNAEVLRVKHAAQQLP